MEPKHRKAPLAGMVGGIVMLVGTLLVPSRPAFADSLWLGNDTVGDVIQTDTVGTVLTTLPSLPVTGIAFDGTSLYFADRGGNFTKRTADGSTVLGSFSVASTGTGEDLAWDSTRNRLWRIVHNNRLQKINPTTGVEEAFFSIPTADPVLGPLGGLGIAYDSTRDLLYVSFCQAGCTALAAGLVDIVDPDTGAVIGELFRAADFYTGGLGYDPASDTLWVGGTTLIRDMSVGGAVLSSFARPPGGAFPDGLEFVGAVPEPATLLLLASGLAGLGAVASRRRRTK